MLFLSVCRPEENQEPLLEFCVLTGDPSHRRCIVCVFCRIIELLRASLVETLSATVCQRCVKLVRPAH